MIVLIHGKWCSFLILIVCFSIVSCRPSYFHSSKILLKIRAKRDVASTFPLTHSKTKIKVRKKDEEKSILFKDSQEETEEPALFQLEEKPRCAEGSTFCESFDEYPYNQLKDILNQSSIYTNLFGKDEVPKLASRFDEGVFVCGSVQQTIFPKIGKNKNNKWKFIINQGDTDGHIQGVRVERCRRTGSTCEVIGEVPIGYRTSCKQKYMYRRMLSITEHGKPTSDTFILPSACCCSYQRDVEFLPRFGSPPTTPAIKT